MIITRQKQNTSDQCLTSRQPVPHFEPVVLAVPLSAWQGVILQVKSEKGEGDIHAGGDDDNEGALQVVWVFVREARRLNETRGTGEVTGTIRTCDENVETKHPVRHVLNSHAT